MRTTRRSSHSHVDSSRTLRRCRALAALLGTLPILDLQCGDEARRQFKQDAFPQIQAGLQTAVGGDGQAGLRQIVNGIIAGVFQTEALDTTHGTDGGMH